MKEGETANWLPEKMKVDTHVWTAHNSPTSSRVACETQQSYLFISALGLYQLHSCAGAPHSCLTRPTSQD